MEMNRLQMGSLTFRVEKVNDLQYDTEDGGKASAFGLFNLSETFIQIEAGLNPSLERVILLHEVLHGILEQTGEKGDHEEQLIDRLAYALMDLFSRNPLLLSYFAGHVEIPLPPKDRMTTTPLDGVTYWQLPPFQRSAGLSIPSSAE